MSEGAGEHAPTGAGSGLVVGGDNQNRVKETTNHGTFA